MSDTATEVSRLCNGGVPASLPGGYRGYGRRIGRPLRNELGNATYHLTSRGSDRRDIYWTDDDRWLFLRLLGIVTVKYEWTLLAYCLMTNHYHLVVRIGDGGLSDGMKWLNGGFSRITNRAHCREAHLFRNRFRSTLVESEAQLARTCRYVILNPVRAGLCERPEEWPWSSYRATAGLDPRPAFLADAEVLSLSGASFDDGRRRYREFVAEGVAQLAHSDERPARDTLVAVSDTATGV